MPLIMSWRFALKNIKANSILQIPFILMISTVGAIFYILSSLSENQFVQKTQPHMKFVFLSALVIMSILAIMFIFYANGFLMKRRNREFGLYAILGLERGQVRRILFLEHFVQWIIVVFMSILAGFFIGKLTFLAMIRLLGTTTAGLGNYSFSPSSALVTLKAVTGIFLVLMFFNFTRISLASPMTLIHRQTQAEKAPAFSWFILILGLITTGAGYALAIRPPMPGVAMLLTWVLAVILVIIGTYCLFTSLSVYILKRQQKKDSYYADPKRFVSISGMLYRIKGHAVGLASISILSCGIITALMVSFGFHLAVANMVDIETPLQYSMRDNAPVSDDLKTAVERSKDKMLSTIMADLEAGEAISDFHAIPYLGLASREEAGVIKYGKAAPDATMEEPNFRKLTLFLPEYYELVTKKPLKIKADEVLMAPVDAFQKIPKSLTLGGKTYRVRPMDFAVVEAYGRGYSVILPDFKTMEAVIRELPEPKFLEIAAFWNTTSKDPFYADGLSNKLGTYVMGRDRFKTEAQGVVGGFFFLGSIISLVMLLGTLIIMYYKQINEGYQDQSQYEIMKKVGLSEDMIKKTSRRQVLWLFALPLLVTISHCLAASNNLYLIISLFGLRSYQQFLFLLLAILAAFALLYYILYKLTSKVYLDLIR